MLNGRRYQGAAITNGNKLDNRVENLEWSTHTENMAHALDTGLKKHFGVIQYDDKGKELARFKSLTEAAEKLQISRTCIFNVCSGRSKQTKGYIFKYD